MILEEARATSARHGSCSAVAGELPVKGRLERSRHAGRQLRVNHKSSFTP